MGEKLFFFHVGAFYIINKNKKIRRKSVHAMPKIKHNFPHDGKWRVKRERLSLSYHIISISPVQYVFYLILPSTY
jgi:hypothetical protein